MKYSAMEQVDSITQKGAAHVTVTTGPTGVAEENIVLSYDEQKGYPYKAVMSIIPNKWLIYNKYDANANHNEFEVKFEGTGGTWAGTDESNASTKTSNANKARILQW